MLTIWNSTGALFPSVFPTIVAPCEIRLRAERKTGELLKELARNQTGGLKQGPLSNDATSEKSPYAETLTRTGISRQTAHRYQALADVPVATFESAIRDPEKRAEPTSNGETRVGQLGKWGGSRASA